jgi:hypothetical protein
MSVCEKHRKFAEYWEELGKPKLEYKNVEGMRGSGLWSCVLYNMPSWDELCHYRIAGDRHFALRKKWVDSDKTLPIDFSMNGTYWHPCGPENVDWRQDAFYREGELKRDEIVDLESKHIEKTCLDNLGDSFIALGNALKDRNVNITGLIELADKCGLELQFRIVAK